MGTPRQPSTIGHQDFIKHACGGARRKLSFSRKEREKVEDPFGAGVSAGRASHLDG